MTDLRDPPAFQWYAADLMADETWILADLNQRGLFATLSNYCWVNGSLPADEAEQARLLSIDAEVLRNAAQCRLISRYFKIKDGRVYSPELERQRRAMQIRRQRLQESGSKGGKKAQQTRSNSKPRLSDAQSLAKASEKRRAEERREEGQQGEDSLPADPWVSECFPETGHAVNIDWSKRSA